MTVQTSGIASPPRTVFGWSFAGWALLLVALTFAAYLPALGAGFVWDDDFHLTKPELQSWEGLRRIWADPRATLQYYPLTHSMFWILHRWLDVNPVGYHVVNILLHAANAILVLAILRKLRIPGAAFAAAVFAVHPVQVESVAWISELKNTLSGFFYLSAALTYLRFRFGPATLDLGHHEEPRGKWRWGWYAGASLLFVAALLSKSVTATLPAALLVVIWWRCGRLSIIRDVVPLVPWFAVGMTLGIMTARWETELWGAQGDSFDLTRPERVLVAGRAVWFYLGKLLWPTNLAFFYERWTIDVHEWWQWLYPAAAVAALGLTWALRRRVGRGPLAAALLFGGTLLPALGFFNLYWHLYTYVCDHMQYLACISIFALGGAAGAAALSRMGWIDLPHRMAPAVLVVLVLAALTWRQSRAYQNLQSLYTDTLLKNPTCWMAYNNLGVLMRDQGMLNEAVLLYRAALDVNPDHEKAHYNLGIALSDLGEYSESKQCFETAIGLKREYADAYNGLGLLYARQDQLRDALLAFQEALRIKPDYAHARMNIGTTLARMGSLEAAVREYRAGLELDQGLLHHVQSTGETFLARGMLDEAEAHFRLVLEYRPDDHRAAESLGHVAARRASEPPNQRR